MSFFDGFFDRLQTVTVHRPTKTTDRYGNEKYGAPWTDVPTDFYVVLPSRSTEIVDGRRTVVTTVTGYAPSGTQIDETCEVTASGKRYRVTGIVPLPDIDDPNVVTALRIDLEAAE